MNILHISDIHFRSHYAFADEGYESVLYRMQSPLLALDTCAESLADQVIDLVLISGDLCDQGSVEDYVILKKHIQKRFPETPMVACPGNHDNLENFKRGWLQVEDKTSDGSSVLELPELVVLAINNTNGKADGCIDKRQVEWLSKQLKTHKGLPVILMMHHHLSLNKTKIPHLLYDASFVTCVSENPNLTIVCGHTHHSFHDIFCGAPYYTAPGMSFCGSDSADGFVRFEEKFGYHLYRYENGRVQDFKTEMFEGKTLNTIMF